MDQVFSDSTGNVARFWCNSRGRMCGSADGWGNCQITGGCIIAPIGYANPVYDGDTSKFVRVCPHCGKVIED